jgi:signal transduction histidine kinase
MLSPEARKNKLRGVFYDSGTFSLPDVSDHSPMPKLFVDPALVQIAFYNVINNAIKYGTSGSSVEIYAEYLEGRRAYAVSVKNTAGIEIKEKEAERVFMPFYRTEEAKKRAATGIGIGLGIARSIMRRHGGDLELSSRSPTVFSFIFPTSLKDRRPANA